jgi:hypothetical protein
MPQSNQKKSIDLYINNNDMKNKLATLLLSFTLFSCGNEAEMKEDIRKVIESKCKVKEHSDKSREFIKKLGELNSTYSTSSPTEMTKRFDEQLKLQEESNKNSVDLSAASIELNELWQKTTEKYKSSGDEKKFLSAYTVELSKSGCE